MLGSDNLAPVWLHQSCRPPLAAGWLLQVHQSTVVPTDTEGVLLRCTCSDTTLCCACRSRSKAGTNEAARPLQAAAAGLPAALEPGELAERPAVVSGKRTLPRPAPEALQQAQAQAQSSVAQPAAAQGGSRPDAAPAAALAAAPTGETGLTGMAASRQSAERQGPAVLHHAAAAARAALSSAISTSRAAASAAAQPQMLPVGREAMALSVARRQPPLASPGSSGQQDGTPAAVQPKEEPLTETPSGGGFAEVSACSLQLSNATKVTRSRLQLCPSSCQAY